MKIAYVTLFDGADVRNWSGTYLHLWKSLEAQGLEVELIGNLRHGPSLARKLRKLWGTHVERRTFLHFWDTDTARGYAADVAARLQKTQADVVISPSPVPLAYLDCPQPKVLWTDATYAALSQDYEEFMPARTCSATAKSAMNIDRATASNCDLLLYASQWGADWAIKDTGADPSRVAVVPYGANIKINHTVADVEEMAIRRSTKRLRLLFVGVDWHRKGAAKAIEVAHCLRQRGLDVELVIVGCSPPVGVVVPSFVKLLGFVSKVTEEGREVLFDLYQSSHFLVVPTVAEAYGLVFAEASAFGVPSLSHRIGGVPTVIRDGVNGHLFDISQPVSDWAEWIYSRFADPEDMRRSAVSSFCEYQNRLNWDVAGANAAARIRECIAVQSSGKPNVTSGTGLV